MTSSADSGDGSLRAAIESANAAARPLFPEEDARSRAQRALTIELALAADQAIVLSRALPEIEGPGTLLDGGGATIRQAGDCRRADGRRGCDGIVVVGPGITVRRLRIAGFLLDGVSVRGGSARDAFIEDVHAIDNRDDGIGVSAAAGPVRIERCLLMGNGFRTKGKGILVFDDSRATIRDSVAVANRDGISVTRRAQARLEGVWIVASFDKGLGVSGGAVRGSDNRIIANGDGAGFFERPPNADGLRVGLAGSADLTSTRIEGNGDAGVVVLDTSSVVLRGGTVRANHGRALVRARTATVHAEGVATAVGVRRRAAPVTLPDGAR
ncbi:MAG: right-handed parallel beta-helix repeat-containing protein [Deltaproteobacteria bacterium]|nr:right-handed parallel beta-helix repeat-containing protein [Deltaproteobacteria bacterium]